MFTAYTNQRQRSKLAAPRRINYMRLVLILANLAIWLGLLRCVGY